MTEIVISSIAVGRWVQQAGLFRAVTRKSRALPQKLPHNLTQTGDYGRYQLEGVEHQGEVLMINPTQDVAVNGQAQELHGRRGGLRLAGATGGAAAR